MNDQLVTPVLTGPLLLLGLFQLFGVKKLFSAESVQVFLWGLAFAVVSLPLLVFINAVQVAPGREILMELGGRLVRIWLIIFGLALAGRWSIAFGQWLWRRRPRPTRYEPDAETDTKV